MDKGQFVKELCTFFVESTENLKKIKKLVYMPDTEFVRVYFHNTDQVKEFSVVGDNKTGILGDFLNFLQHFDKFKYFSEVK